MNYQIEITHRIIVLIFPTWISDALPLRLAISNFLLGPPEVTPSQIFMIIIYLHILNFGLIRHL